MMSALLAGLVAVAAAPVAAQVAPESAQAPARYTFNIPPQPLASALPLFGQQTGLQVTADTATVRGLASPGVQGTLTAAEALQRLLAGTGLTYSIGPGSVVSLQRPDQSVPGVMQLDPVQVQGYAVPPQAMIDNLPPPYAGGQVATGSQLGLLGNRDVMDTPFNQTSYTAKKIQDQQAQTIRDALIDDPSVTAFSTNGTVPADIIRIRGFQSFFNMYGGLFGMLPNWSTMAEMAERVEILKGPSAMLNGIALDGSVGGVVNVVPKRAPNEPLTQLTASYNSSTQFGAHADVGRRFGSDKQFGVRFNGVFRGGETAVANNTDQRALALLGLDFRGESIRLSADLGYQNVYQGGIVPWLFLGDDVPLPWAPDARKNFGQPWSERETKDLFGVVRAEIDLTERITAYVAFGAHDYRQNSFWGSNTVEIFNFNGDAEAQPSRFVEWGTYLTGQAGLRGFVDTGPIEHEFAVTAQTLEQSFGTGFVFGTSYITNVYNPVVIPRANVATPAASKTSSNGQSSVGFADTLSLADKRIQLTVGARWQQVKSTQFDGVTGVATAYYDESAISPAVALVFKPWRNVSVYGNWIQGLQRGTIVGAPFTNAGEVFPPYVTTQYEAGVKIDWGRFTTTASVFQISQPSTVVDVPTNTLVLAGQQRNQGLELNFFGELASGVRLLGGAMFLNAVLTKTQDGAQDGWWAPNSPNVQLRLAGEWDTPFVRGLTLDGRIVYTGSQYIDTSYPRRSVPDWTRIDVGARYTFDNVTSPTGKPVVVRFNVDNLLDANYWLSSNFLGAPRTFRLSLTSNF